MTELEFQRLAQQGYTRIPVLAEARADLYTPLAVYLKLAGGPYSYLLESVVGGERFGRYSFVGLPCAERIEARGARVRRLLRDARGADVCLEDAQVDPLWVGGKHLLSALSDRVHRPPRSRQKTGPVEVSGRPAHAVLKGLCPTAGQLLRQLFLSEA